MGGVVFDQDSPNKHTIGIYVEAAALFVALTKQGYLEEAREFAEWFLDTFDIDLED